MRWIKFIVSLIIIFVTISISPIFANTLHNTTNPCHIAKFKQYQMEYCLYPGKGPLLVFETGIANSMQTWPASFLSKLHQNNAILIYNRLGYGKSFYYQHKINKNIMAKSVAKQLYMLLNKLAINKKKILIAHSIGGIYAQYFVRSYPQVFSGLLLIDADSPFEPIINSPFQSKSQPKVGSVSYYENNGFNSSMSQTNNAPKFPDIPLAVISATNHHDPKDVEKLWQKLQKKLANQSKQGYQIIAKGSGHYVFIYQPQLVINAINQMSDSIVLSSH